MSHNLVRSLSVIILIAVMTAACAAPAATTQAPVATEAPVATKAATTEAVVAEVTAAATETVAAEDPAQGVMLPAVDPSTASGNIVAAGSSTVFPLAEAMAERFKDEGFAGEITIDSVGTGGGFERFCTTGESDIANASRPIKDEEIANDSLFGAAIYLQE